MTAWSGRGRAPWMAALAALPLAATPLHARTEPGAHVIVYDSSGSMYRADTGEYRYRLAQAHVRRLMQRLGTGAPGLPTGLVIFGRQHFQALRRCDDVEAPVPVAPVGTTADRIIAATAAAQPNGQTPLLKALLEAARRMPPDGGRITVVTDLDEETCGGDPCADLPAALEGIGRPLDRVVRVEWVIATGLQMGRNTQGVEKFSRCVNARLRVVGTLAEAEAAADEVADNLSPQLSQAQPQPQPAAPPARPALVPVVVKPVWARPIAFPDWDFADTGMAVWFSRGRAQQQPLQDGRASLDLRPAAQTVNLRDERGQIAAVQVDPMARREWQVDVVPVAVEAEARIEPSEQAVSALEFTWRVAHARRTAVLPSGGPGARFNLPAGRYELSVAVRRPGENEAVTASIVLDLGWHDPAHKVVLPVTLPARPGTLVVHVGAAARTAFARPRGETPVLVLSAADGTRRSATGWDLERALEPGRYALDALLGPVRLHVPAIAVAPGRATRIELSFPAARLVAWPRSGGKPLESADLSWSITPVAARSGAPDALAEERTGPRLDEILPPGRYHVRVVSPVHGVAETEVSVGQSGLVQATLDLER